MKEDFICFEIANKLKEKGFNEKCIAKYCNGSLVLNKVVIDGECEYIDYYKEIKIYDLLSDNKYTILAPTISQVLKWLREEKNIFVVVFIDDDSDCPVTYNIFKGTDCVCHHHEEYFALSEWSKCELIGIKYAIDNLI